MLYPHVCTHRYSGGSRASCNCLEGEFVCACVSVCVRVCVCVCVCLWVWVDGCCLEYSVCSRIVGQPGTRVPGATISTGLEPGTHVFDALLHDLPHIQARVHNQECATPILSCAGFTHSGIFYCVILWLNYDEVGKLSRACFVDAVRVRQVQDTSIYRPLFCFDYRSWDVQIICTLISGYA